MREPVFSPMTPPRGGGGGRHRRTWRVTDGHTHPTGLLVAVEVRPVGVILFQLLDPVGELFVHCRQ